MRWIHVSIIALFATAALVLALSLPAGAFDGIGTYGGYTQAGLPYQQPYQQQFYQQPYQQQFYQQPYQQQFYQQPYQQWQRPGWDTGYPYGTGYQGQPYFSNCYSRCMAQGYGSTYCSQICPV